VWQTCPEQPILVRVVHQRSIRRYPIELDIKRKKFNLEIFYVGLIKNYIEGAFFKGTTIFN